MMEGQDQQTPNGNGEQPAQNQQAPNMQQQQQQQPAPDSRPLEERVVEKVKQNLNAEEIESLAQMLGDYREAVLMERGVLKPPQDQGSKQSEPSPEPTPEPKPNADSARQQFDQWWDYQMSKGGDKADLKNALFEMMQASIGLSTTKSKEEIEKVLEERLNPVVQSVSEMQTREAEKRFRQEHEMTDEMFQGLTALMRRHDQNVTAPEMMKFAQQYHDFKMEKTRQEAEAQAARRSEANMTGFMEQPTRSGFTPESGKQLEEQRKAVREAYKSGDEERYREELRRWQDTVR